MPVAVSPPAVAMSVSARASWGLLPRATPPESENVYSSVASGRAVYVNSDNKIGTLVSSRRFKDEIKPMDKVSETILALKPVTFRYKKEIEPNGAIMFGLIAEEVEKVDPDLVTRNDKGEVETVRYEAVNAMLLNEFLKEHKRGMEQGATITQQRKDFEAAIAQQQKQIEALAAALQKVSAQLAAANGAAGMRSDIDGLSREADVSGSEQVNPSDGGLD